MPYLGDTFLFHVHYFIPVTWQYGVGGGAVLVLNENVAVGFLATGHSASVYSTAAGTLS
jgi:hypothetical protein